MTTSLTERLRASPTSVIMLEAADYIDALEADNKRLRKALRWAAGTLQSACCLAGPISESSPFMLNDETRTVAQIIDAADAALAQEQGGSDAESD